MDRRLDSEPSAAPFTIGEAAAQSRPAEARQAVARVVETRSSQARRRRVMWQRLALAVAFLAVAWLFLRLFSSILMPFVVAAALAYFLNPAVTRLARHRVRRSVGALLMLIGGLLAISLFVLLLYPVIAAQASALVSNIPDYIKTAQGLFGHLIADLQHRLGPGAMSQKLRDIAASEAGTVVSFAGVTVSRIINSSFAVVNILALSIITPIVAFYFLRDWPSIVRHVDIWLPRPYEAVIRAQAAEVNLILAAWIRGQAICCLALAVIYAAGLTIVGLDLGLIVGLTAGLLSFIPYVGTVAGAVTAVLLSLSQGHGGHGVVAVLVVFACGQALNDYVIQPRFLGNRVGLPAVWVIFALFAGGAAFGFLGIMLAVPVTATLGVLVRFWLRRYLASPLYLDAPE